MKNLLKIILNLQGRKYRFRLINAGYLNCPIEISIDKHNLTVFNSDGNDFIPEEGKRI